MTSRRRAAAGGGVLAALVVTGVVVLSSTQASTASGRTSVVELSTTGAGRPIAHAPSGPISARVSAPPATGQVGQRPEDGRTIVSAAQAEELVFSGTDEFRHITRLAAVETTWGQYRYVSRVFADAGPVATLQVAARTRVWVVAASGVVVLDSAPAERFRWAVLVYDRATGAALGETAEKSTSWPSWYGRLVAEAR